MEFKNKMMGLFLLLTMGMFLGCATELERAPASATSEKRFKIKYYEFNGSVSIPCYNERGLQVRDAACDTAPIVRTNSGKSRPISYYLVKFQDSSFGCYDAMSNLEVPEDTPGCSQAPTFDVGRAAPAGERLIWYADFCVIEKSKEPVPLESCRERYRWVEGSCMENSNPVPSHLCGIGHFVEKGYCKLIHSKYVVDPLHCKYELKDGQCYNSYKVKIDRAHCGQSSKELLNGAEASVHQ